MEKFVLEIDGMRCGGCVQRVTDVLKKVPGTQVEKVDIGRAVIACPDNRAAAQDAAVKALAAAGSSARVVAS